MSARIDSIKDQLREIGFEPSLTDETYANIIEAGFNRKTLAASFVLAQILLENQPISVRGAFYRAVSAGMFPGTDKQWYRQTISIVLKLRRSGIIPYAWVADGTRQRYKPSSWGGLDDFAETVQGAYRKDLWASQRDYLEIICEKDAMAGTLRPVADKYDLAIDIIRGNSSETFVWNIAETLRQIEKPVHVFYLGDHDPNGLDLERDIRRRLQGFVDRPIEWSRLGITSEEFFLSEDLVGFPTRMATKSNGWSTRCKKYVDLYGDKCVEIDALPPKEIRTRLQEAVESHIDIGAWQKLQSIERLEMDTIEKTFQAWKKSA